MTLLSSSPLLASLFVSYANHAATLESAFAIPSPESEEWKALQKTVITLQEEIKDSKLENLELTEGLKGAEASQEAFRSQVSSLKEVNTAQQDEIKSLWAELAEAKEKYDRLMVDISRPRETLYGLAALVIDALPRYGLIMNCNPLSVSKAAIVIAASVL